MDVKAIWAGKGEGDGERVPSIVHRRVSQTKGKAWVMAEEDESIVCLQETSGKSQLKPRVPGHSAGLPRVA